MQAIIQIENTKKEYALHNGTVVGRGENCDIILKDSSVSREHAIFATDGENWYVTDNGSTNGTFINDERVYNGVKTLIRDGASISFGSERCTFFLWEDTSTYTTILTEPYERTVANMDETIKAPTIQDRVYPEPRPQQFNQNKQVNQSKQSNQNKPVEQNKPFIQNKQADQGKPKSQLWKIILAVGSTVLAVVVLLLAWCGIWNLVGKKALEEERFTDAASAYSKDILFGGVGQAGLIRNAENSFEKGFYLSAADSYAALGEPGQSRWTTCIRLLASEAYENGDYRTAISYIEKLGEEKQELWNKCQIGLGEEAFQKKEYAEAEERFTKAGDLGTENLRKVQIAIGDEAFAEQDYAKAADYYAKAGEQSQTKWANAVYEEGLRLIQENDPEAALVYLRQIEDDSAAQQQIGVAEFMVAQRMAQNQQYKKAIETVEAIKDTSLIQTQTEAFLREAYYQYGLQLFQASQYTEALDCFRKCPEHEKAPKTIEILSLLIDQNDCYTAAVLAVDSVNNEETDFTLDQWKKAIESFLEEYGEDDLDRSLQYKATTAVFGPERSMEQVKEDFIQNVPTGAYIGSFESTDEGVCIIDSLDSLVKGDYGEIGTKPAGKCLIVICRSTGSWVEKDQAHPYAVSFQLMDCMPSSLYPASLEEVEYIVLITYAYNKEGYYDDLFMINALRENGRVEIIKLPGNSKIYNSEVIYGPEPPDSISYNLLNPPKYQSGGVPNLGEALFIAVSHISGQ